MFVTYTPFVKNTHWKYDLPSGWKWIGTGILSNSDFVKEEQFEGTSDNWFEAYDYLYKYFNDLKIKGIIEKFDIVSTL